MADRCRRADRLGELADLVSTALDTATDLPAAQGGGKGWICRGGRVCSAANRLAGTEVRLTTAQFLLLANRVARGLAAAAPTGGSSSR